MNLQSILENKNLRFILFFVFVGICVVLGKTFQFDVEVVRENLSRFPLAISAVIFILLYVILTTFLWLGPKDIFRISAAILFGGPVSTLFVWISELINAFVMFSLSRKLGQEYIQNKFKLRAEHIEKAKEQSGFWGLFAWKINLAVPLRFIDLGYGLSAITLKKFLTGSLIPTFFRIYLQQTLFAVVGVRILTDMESVTKYMQSDAQFILLCMIYVFIWFVTTVVALILLFLRRRRLKSNPEQSQPS